MEIDTEDLHSMLDLIGVRDSERDSMIKQMIGDFRSNCQQSYAKLLDEHNCMAREILRLESDFDSLCDVLGEQDMKNTKLKASSSLQERLYTMSISVNVLKEDKKTRLEKLEVLCSKSLSLWDFLGITIGEIHRRCRFMMERPTEINGLSTQRLNMLEQEVSRLERDKSEKLNEIANKMEKLDKCLKEANLAGHKDYLPDFTMNNIEKGDIEFLAVISNLNSLIKKAFISQAESFLSKRASASGGDICGITELISQIQQWESDNGAQILCCEGKILAAQLLDKKTKLEKLLTVADAPYSARGSDTDIVSSVSSDSDRSSSFSTDRTSSESDSKTDNSDDPDYSESET